MNPNDYRQLNDPNVASEQNSSAPAWFDTHPEPVAPLPKRSRKKAVVLVAACLLLVASSVLAVRLNVAASPCLTREAYDLLWSRVDDGFNGSAYFTYDELKAGSNFYTREINFIPGSSEYIDTEESDTITKLYSSISGFYKNNGDRKPIIITIETLYAKGSSDETAKQRLQNVRDGFLKAGIPEEALNVKEVQSVVPDNEYSANDIPVIVSIAPQGTC